MCQRSDTRVSACVVGQSLRCDEANVVNDLHVAEPYSIMNMFEPNSDPGSSEAVTATPLD